MLMDISESRETMQMLRVSKKVRCLTTEAVEGAALPLERVDDVEGGDGLALGVLSVCDSIADDAFEEGLEDTTCLFVDHWRGCQLVL